MPTQIHALIFDMDGVITDTVQLHFQAWLHLTREQGIPFSEADNDRIRGLSRRDSLNYVFRRCLPDEDEAQSLMVRKNQYFLELLQAMTPEDCAPGVVRLISEARHAGLKVGLASSSQNVYPVLEKLGLSSTFDAIADHQTVTRTKPAPDVFIWTAGRLNVLPQHTIVFEDSEAGVEAAITGGFLVVGIGDPTIVTRAHHIVPDLEHVMLPKLIEVLTGGDG